jgi:sulfonate transport system ATP-binding protein
MLRVASVSKRFLNGRAALAGIDLEVARGEIVALVGTSGSGKSTLLRVISGLEVPTNGEVQINGRRVEGPSPEIGMVFQEPRLMPWLSVAQNVGFGLDGVVPRAEADQQIARILSEVGLSDAADALPRELSGGMAQRVAIARALVTNPEVLLLDEPFSALDAFIRLGLQDHLMRIWSLHGPTMIFVTHDIEEALALGDRVLVMRGPPGRIHREFRLDIARPRKRTSPAFQAWKQEILDQLDLTLA